MPQSTITDKFQTTIPLEIRRALNLTPRQRLSYELRSDGSVLIRPVPGIDALFGSLALNRSVAPPSEEKQAAREAMAREAAGEGLR
jgi:AbrB family looped-hinge helix DNA binding protein